MHHRSRSSPSEARWNAEWERQTVNSVIKANSLLQWQEEFNEDDTDTVRKKMIFLCMSGTPSKQCKMKTKLILPNFLQTNVFTLAWAKPCPAAPWRYHAHTGLHIPLICSGSSMLSHPEATALFQRIVITATKGYFTGAVTAVGPTPLRLLQGAMQKVRKIQKPLKHL